MAPEWSENEEMTDGDRRHHELDQPKSPVPKRGIEGNLQLAAKPGPLPSGCNEHASGGLALAMQRRWAASREVV